MRYKIYYKHLDSSTITNAIAPEPQALHKKQEFYNKLEQSILEKGFVNPILVQAGYCVQSRRRYLPVEHQQNIKLALCCDRNGGSRLYIAQKHYLTIPCIICDYANRYNNEAEQLLTHQDILAKYTFPPKQILINPQYGLFIIDPHQI